MATIQDLCHIARQTITLLGFLLICDHLYIPCMAVIFVFWNTYGVLSDIHKHFAFGNNIYLFTL